MLTAAGTLTLRRRYLVCPACGSGSHPRDAWLGLDGFLSRQAQRLVSLAAASWSFDRSARLLEEFCGLHVSDTTIRSYASTTGQAMRLWQRQAPAVGAGFAAATGDIEFSTDGTFINTTDGWREMRLGIFAKRPRGQPARPEQWAERDLPAPSVRVLFGGLWTAEQFGPQWRAWAGRLAIRQTPDITILADGARWIWKQAEQNLPGAGGLLDIYHASEHLYGTARVLFGEGASEGSAWAEQRRQTLLQGGAAALHAELLQARQQFRGAVARQSLQELDGYFTPHGGHTDYAGRLALGQSIGSGMVEGACKTVVGKRLKQTGAQWRLRQAERMVTLSGMLYSDLWDVYWAEQHN